jgi:hypothetical protein
VIVGSVGQQRFGDSVDQTGTVIIGAGDNILSELQIIGNLFLGEYKEERKKRKSNNWAPFRFHLCVELQTEGVVNANVSDYINAATTQGNEIVTTAKGIQVQITYYNGIRGKTNSFLKNSVS